MRKSRRFSCLGALALTFSLAWINGCKLTPPLTSADAKTLLQAEYEKQPQQGALIVVDRVGLRQGLDAKYWKLAKVYPNQRWADYALTDEGKKVLKLHDGGEIIQWRPDSGDNFQFQIVTVAANHPRVDDVQEPENDSIPGAAKSRTTEFNEGVVLDGVPQPLQDIAHNPGNRLSSRHHAEFVLVSGKWTVQSIN